MRAALLSEYHTPLELIERPDPEPTGPRSVVVKVAGAGVCQTDLHTIDGHMEPAGVRLPLVLGHENAGWVHAVGDDVTAAAVGDPVLLYPPYSCGLCVPCRRGAELFCDRHQFTGLTQDAWIVAMVRGTDGVSRPLFPVSPNSLRRTGNDTLADLTDGNLGEDGMTTMAFTNPLFVDVDGGGWTAPGLQVNP